MRAQIYKVTGHCLMQMMQDGFQRNQRVIENGIPKDARLVRCFVENQSVDVICLVVESASFDEIPASGRIPEAEKPVLQSWT